MSEGQGVTQGSENASAIESMLSGGTGDQAPVVDPGQGEQQPVVEQAPQQNSNSLADGFLQQIPEADREVVAKYVSAWDAGVTRRFQELHDQVKPYMDLGDPSDLRDAMNAYNLLNENPQAVYELLAQALADDTQQQQAPLGEQSGEQAPFQALPPELMTRFDRNEQLLEAIATQWYQGQQQQQQQAEDQQLDQYLTGLRTEFKPLIDTFGDFDEKWVLTALDANGGDGQKAVTDYYKAQQEAVNRALAVNGSAPTLLSGGGAPPVQEQKVTELDSKDTKSLVAQLVARAAQSET